MKKEKEYTKDRCPTHKKKTMNYNQWHFWADQQIKKGEKQTRCKICGRYLFKEEV